MSGSRKISWRMPCNLYKIGRRQENTCEWVRRGQPEFLPPSVGTTLGQPNGMSPWHHTPLILRPQSDLRKMVYKTGKFDLTLPDSFPITTFKQHACSILSPSPRRLLWSWPCTFRLRKPPWHYPLRFRKFFTHYESLRLSSPLCFWRQRPILPQFPTCHQTLVHP